MEEQPRHWTIRAIQLCFYALFFFTPLVVYPATYELFEFNKMVFVYLLALLIVFFWLLNTVALKQFRFARSPFTIPILLYLLVNVLATIFSIDRHMSIYGYYSRFNGGLLSTIAYTVLFFAFITFCAKKDLLKQYLWVLIGASLMVSAYAIAERLGIDKTYWVQDVQARVFSTFGQPNWLAAFLAMVLPIQYVFLTTATTTKTKIIQFTGFGANLLAFTFTYSRGGMLGLAGAISIMVLGLVWLRVRDLKVPIAMVCLFLLVTILFGNALFRESQFQGIINTIAPPQHTTQSTTSQLEEPGTESSTIRLIVWKGALQIFLHHPLLGTGVETFADAYYQYRPQTHNQTTEWDFLYNKAHNEYLNELSTKGIVGFTAYLIFIASFCFVTIKALFSAGPVAEAVPLTTKSKATVTASLPPDQTSALLLLALLAGYVSYLIQNIFGFSVVMIAVLFFLFPAFTSVILNAVQVKTFSISSFSLLPMRVFAYFVIALILFFGITSIASYWVADLYFSKGYSAALSGYASTAYENISQAISLNSGEPLFQSELGYVAAELVAPAYQQNKPTLAKQLQSDAVHYTQQAITTSPQNIPYLRNAVKVYIALAEVDQAYLPKAVSYAEKTVQYSPTDPSDRLRLAEVYAASNQPQKADQTFTKAIALKPDYADARLGYADFLASEATAATAGPSAKPDQAKLQQAIAELNDYLHHTTATDSAVLQKIASITAELP